MNEIQTPTWCRRGGAGLLLLLWLVPGRATSAVVYVGQTLQEPATRWAASDFVSIRRLDNGTYDWREADDLVRRAQKQGLRLLLRPYFQSHLPLTAEQFRTALAAAVERYDHNGRQDMPELRYPITDWVIDGVLYPESARTDDPAAWADFAVEAYRVVLAGDAHATVVISAGVCEPQTGTQPAADAAYQEKIFVRLGQRFASDPPRNLVIGYQLVADAEASAQLLTLTSFWRTQLHKNHLDDAQVWLLDVSLTASGDAAYASNC